MCVYTLVTAFYTPTVITHSDYQTDNITLHQVQSSCLSGPIFLRCLVSRKPEAIQRSRGQCGYKNASSCWVRSVCICICTTGNASIGYTHNSRVSREVLAACILLLSLLGMKQGLGVATDLAGLVNTAAQYPLERGLSTTSADQSNAPATMLHRVFELELSIFGLGSDTVPLSAGKGDAAAAQIVMCTRLRNNQGGAGKIPRAVCRKLTRSTSGLVSLPQVVPSNVPHCRASDLSVLLCSFHACPVL